MNTRRIIRPLVSSTFISLAALVLSACILPGNVGDDPESGSDEDTGGSGGDFATTTSTTSSASHTSADPSGPPTVTETVTTAGMTTAGPLDPEGALDFCGVPVNEPPPEGPAYVEFIECEGGCMIELEVGEMINLYDYGECLCAAMDCGPLVAGGGSGPAPDGSTGGTGEPGDTDGSDGCGPFPPGEVGFTCSCEMCSIDVTDVEADWLNNEADLDSICDCMCGNTGCGMPV